MFSARIAIAACSAITLLAGSRAHAEVEVRQTLVHETSTPTVIELSEETVLCSAADYSAPVLKVLIPELAALTLLDHQNLGAGAPCVAAGACAPFGDFSPQDVLDPESSSEEVVITVRAVREDLVDHAAMTCATQLVETVDLVIRELPFTHTRTAPLGTRAYQDCLTQDELPGDGGEGEGSGLGTPGPRADSLGAPSSALEEHGEVTPGGCSAAHGVGMPGGLALALIGLLGLARPTRRQRFR